MENSWIGFVAFIVTYIAGRWISERALKTLTENEKGKLVEGFSRYRIVSIVGVVVLLILHFAILNLMPDNSGTTLSIFVVLFVVYLLGSTIYAYRKLKSLEISDNYINQFLFSTLVQYVGLFVFFGFVLNAK